MRFEKGPPLTAPLETIRELIAAGESMREIADKVGLSRQRLYVICRTHNIDFERHRYQREEAKRAANGLGYLASHMKGTAAQMLVAASLMLKHWLVYVPLQRDRSHDLIAAQGDKIMSVEVRMATREKATGRAVCSRLHKSDVLAIVCDGDITFEPPL